MKLFLQSLVTILITTLFTHPVLACSVCFGDVGKARSAFIWTTALMTFVPLTMLAIGVYVIRKLLKEQAPPVELLKNSTQNTSPQKELTHS